MSDVAASSNDPAGALRTAIDLVGGQSSLSRLLGIRQPSVSAWVRKEKHLPAEHVLAVEAATGISRHELRPDLYPVEPTPPAGPERLEGVRP